MVWKYAYGGAGAAAQLVYRLTPLSDDPAHLGSMRQEPDGLLLFVGGAVGRI
eukprot:CAMPEP_0177757828 /NCGR_PEP_ID=MMETSP0491_2-20121128/3848_1 /TAXON_ID=63592 /ORGANISM="Tetraselmis chuii, Strain PLY429" /LENGTH=51 /DNA_ID=CAMNT_0019273499 /DNA_START=79 /DNA_END=231 /DNA_ORIENTATION=+